MVFCDDCHDGDIRTDGGGVCGSAKLLASCCGGAGEAGEYELKRGRLGERSPSVDMGAQASDVHAACGELQR